MTAEQRAARKAARAAQNAAAQEKNKSKVEFFTRQTNTGGVSLVGAMGMTLVKTSVPSHIRGMLATIGTLPSAAGVLDLNPWVQDALGAAGDLVKVLEILTGLGLRVHTWCFDLAQPIYVMGMGMDVTPRCGHVLYDVKPDDVSSDPLKQWRLCGARTEPMDLFLCASFRCVEHRHSACTMHKDEFDPEIGARVISDCGASVAPNSLYCERHCCGAVNGTECPFGAHERMASGTLGCGMHARQSRKVQSAPEQTE